MAFLLDVMECRRGARTKNIPASSSWGRLKKPLPKVLSSRLYWGGHDPLLLRVGTLSSEKKRSPIGNLYTQ